MTDDLHRIAMLRHWGEEEQAQRLLNALNAINRVFGYSEHAMPEPLVPMRDGLVLADASKVSQREFLNVLRGEQIVEVEHLGPGRLVA